ncbi:alpha/beta hydrolase [Ruania halotolerans]|uniref:alpha/beta hydrolase n=1 Tax=Ruania halotolerans TaxID=2897773 RepID=UPI001E4FBE2B|nr:alpha/beta hydrolase [Ruania halotolerans]UFU05076.1 alpha/beta hydrolase [Ruania halotolerans]
MSNTIARVPLVLAPGATELLTAGAAGFILALAGGGYENRSDHEGSGTAEWLTAQGIAAGHLDYPVAPARYPDALDQVLLALADLRAGMYGQVSGPIGVIGYSAGGHLAGTVATATDAERAALAVREGVTPATLARPDLVTMGYPVFSLVGRAHVGSRLNLLGPDHAEELAYALSVENRVDSAAPPAFVWHTADDTTVPVENTLAAVSAWRAARVDVEAHVYPNGVHGVGLALGEAGSVATWSQQWLRWLNGQGVRPAA